MTVLADILGIAMKICYDVFSNYGIAIIIFTLLSKLILLPISIVVQKNSIKMVKMTPDINRIKINYFGDKDKIADEEAKLYKKEKYNAFASLVPLIIQIVLLLGLVQVINNPLTYITKTSSNKIDKMIQVAIENNPKLDKESSSIELSVVNDIKSHNSKKYSKIINDKEIKEIKKINLKFLGLDLSWIASNEKGIAFLIPIIAGLSSLLLCIAQNKMNVLQAEQSNMNKYGMLVLSVGLSLYLGMFVPAGVALYWTASNILAIVQQWILNIFINPKKYVNYEELEKTNKELKELQKGSNIKRSREEKKKEKEDYSRFFKIVNKHLVFYSESNGFYKYYKGVIEYLLDNTNITIHYITSDYNDKIFELEKQNPQVKAYYIGEKKLITLMMKMDADVVIMTMPDLENYHIKRSYLRKDIEYVYMQHSMDSINLTMRNSCINHYDSVFVTDKYQKEECLKMNELYGLKNRKIIESGYPLIDEMIEQYNKNKKVNKQKVILIAPSWQKDNIVDLCLDDILKNIDNGQYKIIVRPHPQHVRHMKEKFESMKKQYKDNKNIVIQTDFSSNDTVYNSDIVITDWSSIANEFAYTTKKPVIFIDTPMKIMNPEYKKIDIEPINVWVRNVIGTLVKLDELDKLSKIVEDMINNKDKYQNKINNLVNDSVYNIGNSAEFYAKYIIEIIQNKIEERRRND